MPWSCLRLAQSVTLKKPQIQNRNGRPSEDVRTFPFAFVSQFCYPGELGPNDVGEVSQFSNRSGTRKEPTCVRSSPHPESCCAPTWNRWHPTSGSLFDFPSNHPVKGHRLKTRRTHGYGSKLTNQGTTGFSHRFHLPRHFGVTRFLPHGHI